MKKRKWKDGKEGEFWKEEERGKRKENDEKWKEEGILDEIVKNES